MKLSIQYKLLAAMFCATLAVVAYMAVVMQWSFDRGFLEYVNLEEQKEVNRWAELLEVYYAEYQNWDTLIEQPALMLRYHALTMPEGPRRERILEMLAKKRIPKWILDPPEDEGKGVSPPFERTVMIDGAQNLIYGKKRGTSFPKMTAIMYQSTEVGSIGIYPPKQYSETHQLLFVKEQKLVILLTAVAALFIIIGIALPLAYHLTKPIRRLSETTRKLKSGSYETRIDNAANDELGQLAGDINALAETLEDNEIQRRQWVSDIAHELRTPLTSLQGEIEALQDGIRTPGSETYARLHRSVSRLNRLVTDLYDLSRYDVGTLSIFSEDVDLAKLVRNEISAVGYEAEKAGIQFEFNRFEETAAMMIEGDRQRLQQLVGNLLSNAISYTEHGGTVTVTLTDSNDSVVLDVQDTPPGVPDEALPNLFNRLYRVDRSRSRNLGGSGLGLAISEQIVLAHNGSITSRHAPQGGLWIQAILPREQDAS